MNMRDSEKGTFYFYDRHRDFDGYRHHNNGGIYFGRINSRDFGIWLTGVHVADSPKRDISVLAVPGRNGDLIVDNNRWNNIDVTYSFAIPTGFADRFDDFKRNLLSLSGYQKLSDSVYPDVFRMAIVKEPIQPEAVRYQRTGTFDVTFHCKPQRYLKSGEFEKTFSEPSKFYGTGFPAKPIITVYGSGPGTLTIGETTVEIKDMADQLTLDCDLQTAYRQVGDGAPENMNGSIYAPIFPELGRDETPISWTGGITKVVIIPRWWTI